jgi:hypothetical protein
MRNIIIFLTVTAIAICFSFSVSAQLPKSGEEDHHQLAIYHKSAAEHAKALHDHAATQGPIDKKFANEYVEQIGASLEAAEKHLSQLEISAKDDMEKFPNEFRTMRTELDNALKHFKLLKTEIDKDVPGRERAKEHSSAIYNSAKKGQEANSTIMKKRGIAEPKEP